MFELIPLDETGHEAGNFGPYSWAEIIGRLLEPWPNGCIIRPIVEARP